MLRDIKSVGIACLMLPLLASAGSFGKKQLPEAQIKSVNTSSYFVENRGQYKDVAKNPVPFVLYKASSNGMDIYITEKGITYTFVQFEKDLNDIKKDVSQGNLAEVQQAKMAWINLLLPGADIKKENIVSEDESDFHYNFYFPQCPDGLKEIKGHKVITVKNIYQGVDWRLQINEGSLKYDFIVHPGADASKIKLIYESETPAFIDDKGRINVKTPIGTLIENAPYCFVKETGNVVESGFQSRVIDSNNIEINFSLSKYSNAQTLVIDPQLWWSTFFGGTNIEYMTSAECDANNNLFIAGHTQSADFPLLNAGTYYSAALNGAAPDIVIMKFTSAGVLLWSTYYGGSNTDQVFNITIDNANNLFLNCSVQSNDMPIQNSGTYYDNTLGGVYDLVLLKFDNAGNRLWGTYFGGSAYDEGMGICHDAAGNIFIVGNSQSADFPMLNSGTYFDNTRGGTYDMFISKFDNTGNLLWSTYYGGATNETGYAVCCDPSNNIFITGSTTSADFPVLNAGTYFDNAISSTSDAFILKFDNAGNRLWATYYGGNNGDFGNSICSTINGDIFIVGRTQSSDFPVLNTGKYFDNTLNGTMDAFVLQFDNAGNRLWATYLGGGDNEVATSYDNIVADSCSNVFLTFGTKSTDIITQNSCIPGFLDNTLGSTTDFDVYVAKFSDRGGFLWSTYYGGDGNEALAGMAIDNNGDIYITGVWQRQMAQVFTSASYPTVNPGGGALFSATLNATAGFSGTQDGYVCKFINKIPLSLSHTVSSASSCACSGVATLTVSGGCVPYKTNWYDNTWALQTSNDTLLNACAGNYRVVAIDTINCAKDTLAFTITADTPLLLDTLSVTHPACITTGSVTTTLSGGSSPYSYSWSSAHTTSSATGLVAGTYSLVISDNKNCKDTLEVVLINSGSITAQITGNNSVCAGAALALSASGGNDYSWSTGSTNATINVNPTSNTTYTLIANSGLCSDTVTYNITVNAPTTNTINALACNSYTLNGQTYSSTGVYTQTLVNSQSCDSILSINLTISPAINTNTTVSVCSGQSVIIHGVSQNTSAVYTQTFIAVGGCDSISAVTLNVSGVLTGTINPVSCTSYTLNGQTYATAGLYTQSLTSVAGCDSVLTINLTISPAIVGSTNLSVCSGTSVSIHGQTQTLAGIYTQSFVTAGGCDSISNVTLSVVPTPTLSVTPLIDSIYNGGSITVSASGADSYLWDNGGLTNSIIVSPLQTTRYCIVGVNGGVCADTLCSDIIVLDTDCGNTKIYVPTGFSPNGDGQNDELMLFATGPISTMYFAVYNRWGQIVFETTDINKKWDGTLNGKALDSAVFTYTLKYTCLGEVFEEIIAGNISLVK